MKGMKQILEQVWNRQNQMGGALAEEVIAALSKHRSLLRTGIIALYVVVIIVMVISLYGVTSFMDDPARLKAFTGAMGVTIFGTLEFMRRIWREWSREGLLLILAEDATESQISDLLDRLIQKL